MFQRKNLGTMGTMASDPDQIGDLLRRVAVLEHVVAGLQADRATCGGTTGGRPFIACDDLNGQDNPASKWISKWISLERAAAELRVSVKTARVFVRLHGLGHRPAGRWLCDQNRITAWRSGLSYPPL
jgi:hypothetical protein